MPYRPTERTEARRVAARGVIVDAATELVAHGGYREAQVAAVARRAGVATGTVYRHFPSKADLLVEVFRRAARREVDAVASATAGREDARDALAEAVRTFARRALRSRRLAWALLAEPVDPAVEAERLAFRRAYAAVFAATIRDGIARGQLPAQDAGLTATALVGAVGEALVDWVAPASPTTPARDAGALLQGLVTFCLRATTDQEHDADVHHHAA
ncbi:TetR/AcrR family transcriptional regulator [Baekduia soli]|uniref:TetR/AcrR family transcriptional regulator n=1 Tax=Baekduia soli TaxID=496014 RepID=A0A5B8U3M9_9ACTN|nr:TetR/AcrR family transcriptional regulator [Baekduia soli]QEC47465.1 TetR/AcrR family transcriptional regulator [Baekduia soli]